MLCWDQEELETHSSIFRQKRNADSHSRFIRKVMATDVLISPNRQTKLDGIYKEKQKTTIYILNRISSLDARGLYSVFA